MIDQPCTYCGAKAGHPCSGYGLVDGDMHEARLRGATKASDVVDLGRARALLGCSSEMSLLDGVRRLREELERSTIMLEREAKLTTEDTYAGQTFKFQIERNRKAMGLS